MTIFVIVKIFVTLRRIKTKRSVTAVTAVTAKNGVHLSPFCACACAGVYIEHRGYKGYSGYKTDFIEHLAVTSCGYKTILAVTKLFSDPKLADFSAFVSFWYGLPTQRPEYPSYAALPQNVLVFGFKS